MGKEEFKKYSPNFVNDYIYLNNFEESFYKHIEHIFKGLHWLHN